MDHGFATVDGADLGKGFVFVWYGVSWLKRVSNASKMTLFLRHVTIIVLCKRTAIPVPRMALRLRTFYIKRGVHQPWRLRVLMENTRPRPINIVNVYLVTDEFKRSGRPDFNLCQLVIRVEGVSADSRGLKLDYPRLSPLDIS